MYLGDEEKRRSSPPNKDLSWAGVKFQEEDKPSIPRIPPDREESERRARLDS